MLAFYFLDDHHHLNSRYLGLQVFERKKPWYNWRGREKFRSRWKRWEAKAHDLFAGGVMESILTEWKRVELMETEERKKESCWKKKKEKKKERLIGCPLVLACQLTGKGRDASGWYCLLGKLVPLSFSTWKKCLVSEVQFIAVSHELSVMAYILSSGPANSRSQIRTFHCNVTAKYLEEYA